MWQVMAMLCSGELSRHSTDSEPMYTKSTDEAVTSSNGKPPDARATVCLFAGCIL